MKTTSKQNERTGRIWVNVGITGKRTVAPEKLPLIEKSLRDILRKVRTDTCNIYGKHKDLFDRLNCGAEPGTSLISSLAEGADRMAACIALELDYTIQCPLPMGRGKYVDTFSEGEAGLEEFNELLGKAESIFEIEQPTEYPSEAHAKAARSQAYADASRVMLDHSDLLIAIWDGQPTKYTAGTYATMQMARKAHIPIIYIPTEDPEHCRYINDTNDSTEWKEILNQYLKQILLPVSEEELALKGKVDEIVDLQCGMGDKWWWKHTPALTSYIEKMLLFFSGKRKKDSKTAATKRNEPALQNPWAANPWPGTKKHFSTKSGLYAKIYRNRIILRDIMPLFAAICLFITLISASQTVRYTAFAAQLVFLLLGFLQVWWENCSHVQRKFTYHRVLAERCRLSALLWPVGFCNVRYRHSSYLNNQGSYGAAAWYYRILARQAGLPSQSSFNEVHMKKFLENLKEDFVLNQQTYHTKTYIKSAQITTNLQKLSIICFIAGFIATIVKTWNENVILSNNPEMWGMTLQYFIIGLAVLFPALASYFSGFASNFGYTRNFSASKGMCTELKNVQTDIINLMKEEAMDFAGKTSFTQGLCYTDIYNLAERVDACCQEEVSDWEDSIQSYIFKYNS